MTESRGPFLGAGDGPLPRTGAEELAAGSGPSAVERGAMIDLVWREEAVATSRAVIELGGKCTAPMARYKHYDYTQTMLVAVSLADQLQAGTLEHTIHYVVEERLDLRGFDQERSNDETGRPGYDPRVLL